MGIIPALKGLYIEIERASDRFNVLALCAPDLAFFRINLLKNQDDLEILGKIFRNIN
jgi:hypothetical protein